MKFSVAIILLLLSGLGGANAFVVLARESTNISTDIVLDSNSLKLVAAGINFRDVYKDYTLEGQSDTDCYISSGDIRGFDRVLFESPQMCLKFDLFPGNEGNLPQGIVTGIQGNQASVFNVEYYGEYDEVQISNPINLPPSNFPVAVSVDSEGGVYVGLHDTKGALPPTNRDDVSELSQVLEYLEKMTSHTDLVVQSPSLMKLNITSREVLWQQVLTTEDGQSTISDVVHLPSRDLLGVVGSSNGKGMYVGAGVVSAGGWDGYFTLVDAATGLIDDRNAQVLTYYADHSKRISSQPGQDDFVLGLCVLEDKVFLMGTTTGKIDGTVDGGGFIMKLDLDTLSVLWKHQFVGDGVAPFTCRAAQDFIYVAGHVPAGVLLDDPTRDGQTSPDQDIFAALLSAQTGEVKWLRQVDSRREDKLSNIAINQVGNLLIEGNAMDLEAGTSNVFLLSMIRATGFHDWENLSRDADPISGAVNDGDGTTTLPPGGVQLDQGNGEVSEETPRTTVIVLATVIPVVLALIVIIYAVMTIRSKKESSPEIREAPIATNDDGSLINAATPLGKDRVVV